MKNHHSKSPFVAPSNPVCKTSQGVRSCWPLLLVLSAACSGGSDESDDNSGPPGASTLSMDPIVVYHDVDRNGLCDFGDTLTVTFSDRVVLAVPAAELAIEQIFGLYSYESGNSGGPGPNGGESFGYGATYFLGEEPGVNRSKILTIVLGEGAYLKVRQYFGHGSDSILPTELSLRQDPSPHLLDGRFVTPRGDSVRRSYPGADIIPGLVFGETLLGSINVRSVEVADLDGDGDLDIICGLEEGQLAGDIALLFNDGESPAGFSLGTEVLDLGVGGDSEGSGWVDTLECADFDGDGDLDILGLCSRATAVWPLWLNAGDGTFSRVPFSQLTGIHGTGASVGDLDHDGDLDLAVCDRQSNRVMLFENSGAGLFDSAPVQLDVSSVRDVVLSDFSLDGWLDVITTGEFAATKMWLNDGTTQSLGFGSASSITYSFPREGDKIYSWDANHDGAVDFITTSQAIDGDTWIHLNDGEGSFGDVHRVFGVAVVACYGDLDGDGHGDLILGSRYFNSLRLYPGHDLPFSTNPFWNLPSQTFEASATSMAIADLDGDGDPDLVLGNRDLSFGGPGGCQIVSDSLSGVFGRLKLRAAESTPGGDVSDIHLADMDGDADLDLVSIGATPLQWNDGYGAFSAGNQTYGLDAASDIAVGDLDQDGDLDMAIAWDSSTALAQGVSFLANDYGDFSPLGSGLQLVGVSRLELADLNGDSYLDLYCISESNVTEQLYVNDGSGSFTLLVDIVQAESPQQLVFADMDRDGDLDMVRTNSSGSLAVLFNDGLGTFTSVYLTSMSASALCVADVDMDGDPDVVVCDGSSQRVLFNQGSGLAFSNGTPFGSSFVNGIVARDMDGDGDLDLLLASNSADEPIWVNNGAGEFSPSPVLLPGSLRGLSVGDIDLDGDQDLLMAPIYAGGTLMQRGE